MHKSNERTGDVPSHNPLLTFMSQCKCTYCLHWLGAWATKMMKAIFKMIKKMGKVTVQSLECRMSGK